MIELTRFDGTHFYVNVEFIEFVETTPDTVVSLIDHKKLLVRESAADVVQRIADYHHQIAQRGPSRILAMQRWNAMSQGHDGPMTESEDES